MKIKAAICIAVVALVGVIAPSASAKILPLPPAKGQPLLSGELEKQGFIHCQPLGELLLGEELPPGTAPGGIVVLPSGEWKFVGACTEFAL